MCPPTNCINTHTHTNQNRKQDKMKREKGGQGEKNEATR
jgi:hypothetical protein